MLHTAWRLVLGALIGFIGGVAFLATPALFSVRESLGLSSQDTGTIAGAMLGRLNWLTLGALVLLGAIEVFIRSRHPGTPRRTVRVLLLVAGVLTLLEMVWITPLIHEMRELLVGFPGRIEGAPPDLRARFGIWHGVSMTRALAVWLACAGAFLADGARQSRACPG